MEATSGILPDRASPDRSIRAKVNVVVINYVQQRRKTSVMIIVSLIRRVHEQAVFTNEETVQVHCLINIVGRAVSLEAVNTNVVWFMQVPSRLCPERFHMTVVASSFAAEEFISTRRCCRIEVFAGSSG